ncbi:MAG: hypothetical protein ABIC96_01990 [Patescibacteria group bacterium]
MSQMAEKYTPSPLEAAFDAEINKRFSASLKAPRLNKKYSWLTRGSKNIVWQEDGVLAFQYTRFDSLKRSLAYVVEVYKHYHPVEDKLLEEGKKEMTDLERIDQIDAQIDEEDRIATVIAKQLTKRHGRINRMRALTDPSYCLQEARISQWPEKFEFALFRPSDTFFQEFAHGSDVLGRHGRLNGQRPEFYGSLEIAPCFEGSTPPIENGRLNQLVLEFPENFYRLLKASVVAFGHIDPEKAARVPVNQWLSGGIELDDVGWVGASYKPPMYPLFPDIEPPEKIMGQIGTLVEQLCVNPSFNRP